MPHQTSGDIAFPETERLLRETPNINSSTRPDHALLCYGLYSGNPAARGVASYVPSAIIRLTTSEIHAYALSDRVPDACQVNLQGNE
jgi:hypothetical protein